MPQVMPHVAPRRRSRRIVFGIKKWPVHDRPRERLRMHGAGVLSPRELLALILETGTPAIDGRPSRSALDLAGDVLRWFCPVGGQESLRRVMSAEFGELCRVPGIGPAKAGKMLAAFELGRRAVAEAQPPRAYLAPARDVYEHLRLSLRDLPQEELHALLLNASSELLRDVLVCRGTAERIESHARDVFRVAIAENAYSVVLVHNHPSGEPTPSPQDHAFTAEMAAAGRLVGIPVMDHIIIGEARYVSFAESGIMDRL